MERVKVQIDGMSFYVVGDEEADYIKDLAKELNEMYDITNRSNGRLNQVQAQVLTSLNLLDQCKKMEKRLEEVKNSSEDALIATEKEKQLEELREQVAKLESKNSELSGLYSEVDKESKSLLEEKKELLIKVKNQEEQVTELKESLLALEKKIEALEDKNYNAQLNITDLNKEISILRGEA